MRASEQEDKSLTSTHTIKILIADDDPPTRILLRAAVTQWGYEVVEASNGEEAWEILLQPNPPRLLILDWLMPQLDGIALCARIKKEDIFHPYTILLTQVTGTANIIKGLEAGADEFLSKPFNMAELRSRLSVGARIINFENTLAEQNKKVQEYALRMESLAQAHAKKLVHHSDLLGMLGSLVEGISQEIYDALTKLYHSSNTEPLAPAYLEKIQESRLSLEHVITVIKRLQVNTIHSNKTSLCQVNDLIKNTLDASQSATKHIKIELNLEKNLPSIEANPEQLQEMFLSIILSTVEALKNHDPAYIQIKTSLADKTLVRIIIEDSGTPIPITELEMILQPQEKSEDFKQIRSRPSIAMCKEIIEKFKGKLSIENRNEGGARFIISFPAGQKNNERAT